ncbi:hypothetical protein [Terracoccus sp. 273MFTsu3.1]|uniref:hypothetical protein n=1 Tax=Terracoccus sp. 273MFTsu3.1 TaxID=1172188 RepID=UPI00035FCDAB|nr:hypothetical protein [Terracoccus sp. 273MFTsu3.1]
MGPVDREIAAIKKVIGMFQPGLQYTAVQIRQIAGYAIAEYEREAEKQERQKAAQQVVKNALKVKGTKVHIGGVTLHNVHLPFTCHGETCWIHKPSAHHMRNWDVSWRADRHMLERHCPEHGVGHPDPDQPLWDWTHGCCGCCLGTHYAPISDISSENAASTVSGEQIA